MQKKVTKKFYTEFKKQHSQFLDFIQGIDDALPDKDNTNKQWYASLMLNRLMFCYFIQKKGFLDQDKHYLKNKLKACQELSGNDNFYSFYRSFLLELFHDGLGKPINKRNEDLPVELGKIPYLNGGLFDVHELERQFEEIHIDDDAFERIFEFFDKWEWHLDTREHAEGKTINPDVIGYIFEKYINDRAAMGAYYTKEDVTDYIGKNTIIPFLFDETERHYKEGFKPESELWLSLKESGNAYIYDAVKYGVPKEGGLFDDLPEEVQGGFLPELEKQVVKEDTSPHLWEIRKSWNQRSPQDIGLPTEIYRELIERRKRYADVRTKIAAGEITHINDFITYNMNTRQFTQDYIEHTEDPAFIRLFYKALNKVTILDPTCGSGAFLFAAMNILEPLYETCLKRMEEFIEEQPGKHKFFEETLEKVNRDEHPNLQYFIYKSIILNNLYGVDIMKEAVEIAKLRLFLKLVAVVDVEPDKKNFGLEPLPDIDFNIRTGNTLVGFATENELLNTIQKKEPLFAKDKLDEFKEEFELVAKAFGHFQNSQLINDQGSDSFREAKAELNRRLRDLNHKLNVYLATNYGVDAEAKPAAFTKWLDSHQPFHWFAEFYRIVDAEGGFDVIIGNPPYVVYSDNSFTYKVKGYDSFSCNDLYGYTIERTYVLNYKGGRNGMIVPISLVSTDGFDVLRRIMLNRASRLYFSSYAMRPGKLFDGVDKHLTIFISSCGNTGEVFSSKYHRWNSDARESLIPQS
ncbi:MAG: DNA methyltransferase [Bacteroidota bacterium]|nr:DNA methyltransferase [Bacteroidota bacterium]